MESRGPFGQWHGPCGIESVDRNRVRLVVKLAISRLAVMQARIGKTGISAMNGVGSSGSPEPEWEGREGQPGAREGQSKRQKTCLRAARPAAGARGRAS